MKSLLYSFPAVLLGYFISVLSAPIFALISIELIAFATGGSKGVGEGDALTFILAGIQLTGLYAALPFAVAIGAMRLFRLRQWFVHSFAGAVVAYAALALLLGEQPSGTDLNPAFLIAGAGAGIVYWFVRRRAGWIRPSIAETA